MQADKAVASLSICTDSPEPSLLADAKCTEISCTGTNGFIFHHCSEILYALSSLLSMETVCAL